MTIRTNVPKDPPPAPARDEPQANVGEAEFDLLSERRAAVTPARLASTRGLDPYRCATLVQAALAALGPYRDAILSHGGLTAERFDGLASTARAARFAHTRWSITARPQVSLASALADAIEVRDGLLDAARAASRKNLVDGSKLAELGAGRSAEDVGQNLTALHDLLRNAWDKLAGKTALEPADLDTAQEHAEALAYLVGRRDGTDTAVAQAADDRARSVALLVGDWDEVRRAMQFIRYHEDDAEVLAPTLYQRSAPRRTARNEGGANGAGGEGSASDAGSGADRDGTANQRVAAAGGAPGATDGADALRDPSTAVGMPNSRPFTHDPAR